MAVLVHPQSELIREPRLLVPRQVPVGNCVMAKNSLTSGLAFALVPGIASRNLARPENHPAALSRSVFALNGMGGETSQRILTTGALKEITSEWTFVIRFIFVAVGSPTNQSTILGVGPAATTTTFGFNASHSSGGYAGAVYCGTGYTIIGKPTGNALSLNIVYDIAATRSGSAGSVFNNGQSTGGAGSLSAGNPADYFGIGMASSSADTCTVRIQHLFVWSRALQASDIASVYDDPYQFLIPA